LNFLSAFQSEVFRPLVTLLIPGALAISSWIVAILWKFPSLRQLSSQNQTPTVWLIVLLTIMVGIIIEDWGTRIETRWDKRADKKTKDEHTKNWCTYLRTSFIADPIGRRYARSIVLRLKFELGVFFASIISVLGLGWLLYLGMQCGVGLTMILLCSSLAAWEYKEAADTHKLLGTVRAELVKEIRIISEDITLEAMKQSSNTAPTTSEVSSAPPIAS